jgi:hypothetical protein
LPLNFIFATSSVAFLVLVAWRAEMRMTAQMWAMLAGLEVLGCSSFLHFSDPTTQAVTCAILAPEEAIIESSAAMCGPFAPACLSALQALFGDACATAAAAGRSQDESHKAGLAAVQKHAGTMKASLEKAGVKAP